MSSQQEDMEGGRLGLVAEQEASYLACIQFRITDRTDSESKWLNLKVPHQWPISFSKASLPKVPQPYQTVPASKDDVFKHMCLWRPCHIHTEKGGQEETATLPLESASPCPYNHMVPLTIYQNLLASFPKQKQKCLPFLVCNEPMRKNGVESLLFYSLSLFHSEEGVRQRISDESEQLQEF